MLDESQVMTSMTTYIEPSRSLQVAVKSRLYITLTSRTFAYWGRGRLVGNEDEIVGIWGWGNGGRGGLDSKHSYLDIHWLRNPQRSWPAVIALILGMQSWYGSRAVLCLLEIAPHIARACLSSCFTLQVDIQVTSQV